MKVMLSTFLLVSIFTMQSAHARQAMKFSNKCAGNAIESCFILADGEITSTTPADFIDYLETKDAEGGQILLNSRGGNLGAGLALGRIIREHGYHTHIGVWRENDHFGEMDSAGVCESACAYAFLGGIVRRIGSSAKLGFHQVSLARPASHDFSFDQTMQDTQRISSQLVSYVTEMGVDARIFAVGAMTSPDDMAYPSREDLDNFGIITRDGFGDFFLEPHSNGIVAASRHETGQGGMVKQLTSFCRNGRAHILMYASEFYAEGVSDLTLGGSVDFQGQQFYDLPRVSAAVRMSGNEAYIQGAFSGDVASLITRADTVRIWLNVGRAYGSYQFSKDLSDMDRKMIEASFRFCL